LEGTVKDAKKIKLVQAGCQPRKSQKGGGESRRKKKYEDRGEGGHMKLKKKTLQLMSGRSATWEGPFKIKKSTPNPTVEWSKKKGGKRWKKTQIFKSGAREMGPRAD